MRKFIFPIIVIALIAGGGFFAFSGNLPNLAATPEPTVPAQTQAQAVVADAKVLPAADVTLSFDRAGTVAEIMVREGDAVQAGQPLARLDTRALELRVQQAQVGLDQAQARYEQIAAGASPEAIAAADAAIAQAQASATQVAAGVTSQDLAAAQAQLAEANAALAQLLDGPKSTEVTQAQAALDQATANLSSQRDGLSAAKTNAQLQLDQAANALRNAQDSYSLIYWDNRDKEALPGDMPQELIDAEAAALRAVDSAQAAMAQAQVAMENAGQAESEGIASAEARVRDAQARLEQLVAPADADKVAAAKARVAAAQANLAKLRGPARSTQLDVAEAAISQAAAAREQVAAPAREVDLTVAKVAIDAAKVTLDQAQLDLDQATLSAPFAGTVAQIDLDVGALTGPSGPAIVLADLSSWRIETDDLTELDVVKLREGDAVTVTFDALPDVSLPGTISQIKPLGSNRQGDIVYTVVVALGQEEARLRWNMTAVVTANS
ncbi:biotin/lipoyl-binding protein [Chloroflexales bacterium ZM16-3]|nr:biotin/lipoyl-binding protein [Chloroflexales bacterium ZM16-3]